MPMSIDNRHPQVDLTRGELLDAITKEDCILKGFPELEPAEFVRMLVDHYRCGSGDKVNRIEFEYI